MNHYLQKGKYYYAIFELEDGEKYKSPFRVTEMNVIPENGEDDEWDADIENDKPYRDENGFLKYRAYNFDYSFEVAKYEFDEREAMDAFEPIDDAAEIEKARKEIEAYRDYIDFMSDLQDAHGH